MVDYSRIKARPTRYRGILFRSRLEATWAAFFDQIAWPWEYEPFELDGWLPDFLIKGKEKDLLVEIKPVHITDEETQEKMMRASEGYDAYLMIGGRKPHVYDEICNRVATCCKCSCEWMGRAIVIDDGCYDIVFGHGPYTLFRSGKDAEQCDLYQFAGREIDAAWARAQNATQWRPR